jgi:hypothetical protein
MARPPAQPAGAASSAVLADFAGASYVDVMKRLHDVLHPASYFEIGTDAGQSLAMSACPTVAVDPKFAFADPELMRAVLAKPALALYRMTSDAFFAQYDLTAILGRKVDLAFLDGMHRCEFLLRDFCNTERHCNRNSIIALHDCLPLEEAITARTHPDAFGGSVPTLAPHRHNWWTGDVWRTALLLKRVRPDLQITALDAQPTGLVLVTNLDPDNRVLHDGYAGWVNAMMSWHLSEIGVTALLAEMQVRPTSDVWTDEQITARFWL